MLFPLATFEVLAAYHAEDTVLYDFSIRQEVRLLVVEVQVVIARRLSDHSWDWLEWVTYKVCRRDTVNWALDWWGTVVVDWVGLRGRSVDWRWGKGGRRQVDPTGDWWRLQIGRLRRRSNIYIWRRTVMGSRWKGLSLLDRYVSCGGFHLSLLSKILI